MSRIHKHSALIAKNKSPPPKIKKAPAMRRAPKKTLPGNSKGDNRHQGALFV